MLEEMYLKGGAARQVRIPTERRLPFSGVKNFRDLGGYPASDGRSVRWGVLYRSDALHRLTDSDRRYLSSLHLDRVIDFRANYEKDREPDRLPDDLKQRLVEIPILDNSTGHFQNSGERFVRILKTVDASMSMIDTNVELATRFTPEMRQFIEVVFSADGRPNLFHCAAGKDRTGFAAAILLRLLDVPQEVVMQDYLLTNQYFLRRYAGSLNVMRLLRGRRFAESVRAFMIAQPAYLSAAFRAIDETHGSFENYVCDGLGLTKLDVARLQSLYLE